MPKTEQVSSEKRGCRACGRVEFHTFECRFNKSDVVKTLVLDSERSPERHEQPDEHLYPHQYCHGCGAVFETTNQRSTHRCPTPQPQSEATLCVECGHNTTLRTSAGRCGFVLGYDSTNEEFEICGHRCIEAPAVAERCKWTEDSDGNWATSCGQDFVVNSDTPSSNGMLFCFHCGKHLEEVEYQL